VRAHICVQVSSPSISAWLDAAALAARLFVCCSLGLLCPGLQPGDSTLAFDCDNRSLTLLQEARGQAGVLHHHCPETSARLLLAGPRRGDLASAAVWHASLDALITLELSAARNEPWIAHHAPGQRALKPRWDEQRAASLCCVVRSGMRSIPGTHKAGGTRALG